MQPQLKTITNYLLSSRVGGAIFALVLAFAGHAFAGTLEDYHKRLDTARVELKQLRLIGDGGSEGSRHKLVSSIRSDVPATENIDWPGGSIDTDNGWLHSGLDAFAAQVNLSKQEEILDHLDERLEAVAQKISELEAATAGKHAKDEDKQKLAEILRREEYQKPAQNEESLFQKWSRQILEWLAKMFPRVNFPQQETTGLGSLSFLLQILLYVVLAAGLGFLIYRILPFFSGRFGSGKKSPNNERVILGERIGDDESSHDLFAEAERLARSGEMRLAIRMGYIALLCELNDRKIIGLASHKTNRDYLRDLRSRSALFENVRGLTGSFERHWYGSDVSEERDWDEFRVRYLETIRGV